MLHAKICVKCRNVLNREDILKEIPEDIRKNGPIELKPDKISFSMCPTCSANFLQQINQMFGLRNG